MLAAWYDRHGAAHVVLQTGQIADRLVDAGQVRVRVSFSGINPADVDTRAGRPGAPMGYPRVIPHSDASGTIESAGPHVNPNRVGTRVWIYGAQAGRPFGTAAQYVVVPTRLAIPLPDEVSDKLGATLSTRHRAVFGDGPVEGKVILVHDVLGRVGSLAADLAVWGGTTVIGRSTTRPT